MFYWILLLVRAGTSYSLSNPNQFDYLPHRSRSRSNTYLTNQEVIIGPLYYSRQTEIEESERLNYRDIIYDSPPSRNTSNFHLLIVITLLAAKSTTLPSPLEDIIRST
uniref:Uncharacterized protein n=1 Tax=Picea glauca TaxID=3330 RepID=A0A101LZI1_PICGL|nr:hypothetical protein ABT39_MTgene5204 [Picea glauca]QHR91183.1 hypothetical protein Q903MT_gene5215 [Picea sitchensis]